MNQTSIIVALIYAPSQHTSKCVVFKQLIDDKWNREIITSECKTEQF